MENNSKTPETGENNLDSDAQKMKEFAQADSSSEIKSRANQIHEADPDVDREKLDDSAQQFHKEKKEDAKDEAENDADFEQPKTDKPSS